MKVRTFSLLVVVLFFMSAAHAEIQQMDITVFGMD